MRLVKSTRGSTLATLLIFGLAACGESPLAPVPESPALSSEASEPLMASHGDADSDSDSDEYKHNDKLKSGSRTFTIRPGRAVRKKLGDYALWVPANVVCDPETSGYGPSYWSAPCQPINRRIKVTAKWGTVNGQAVIVFTPRLRFVPTSDRSRWVILQAKHPTKDVDPTMSFAILWYNPETLQWVDESATDPTLAVQVDRRGKIISRRLKHFSRFRLWTGRGSYNVTSGHHDPLGSVGGNW